MNVPCKDCADRKINCHSTCEKYKEFRAYKDSLNKEAHERSQNYYYPAGKKRCQF